jgi:aminoglycoside 6-adenylyltransferase
VFWKMKNQEQEKRVIEKLVHWAEDRPTVRAMLLTSSRVNPNAPVDVLSDYDVILVVIDVHPFFDDRSWLEDFGPVLVVYRDPIKDVYGGEKFAYITQYEDGTKIDFTFWSLDTMRRVAGKPDIVDELDLGYAVLLDKDRLADGLGAPTFKAFIPTPPTEAAYQNIVEEFFHEATYVAKHLWRDDLIAAKYNLDYGMKLENLRTMLEWRMEIDYHWSVKPGVYGRGLKRHLAPEIWSELERTYVGANIEDNWQALFATIELLSKVAIQVGNHFGYKYPHGLHERVIRYLQRVKSLDHDAELF